MTQEKLDQEFQVKIVATEAYKNCPVFKQALLTKRASVSHLRNAHDQCKRLGIEYVRQYVGGTDMKVIEEILNYDTRMA